MRKSKQTKEVPKMPLNFFAITRKFWKDQIFFYFLTILSFLTNYVIDTNGFGHLFNAIKSGKAPQSVDFKVFGKTIYTFQNWKNFLWFMGIFIIVYCLMVIAHVYFAYWFANKISRWLKKRAVKKVFQYRNTYNKGQVLNNFGQDTKNFAEMVIFVPNQIFYMLMGAAGAFYKLWDAQKKGTDPIVLWLGVSFFILVTVLCFALNYFLYRRDLLLQKAAEEQTKKEDILINNRDLIIKKNLVNQYQKNYGKTIDNTYKFADKKDWTYTLLWVVPSYSLIPFSEFIFLPFLKGGESFVAIAMVNKLFGQLKKTIDRLKNYPYYFSARKRLSEFFSQPERNDIQKNILISESIEKLTLRKVSFGYKKGQLVLKKLDLQFQRGKINHLIGENGFGKSTIISLIMGLYQPSEGEILVNDKYKLSEVNLIEWREKVAYGEHQNLIENGLSTGQKQLTDLNNLFATIDKKEVFIFDEADNALDEDNRKWFWEKIEKISEKKLVILIRH